jgi:hypothetical protein
MAASAMIQLETRRRRVVAAVCCGLVGLGMAAQILAFVAHPIPTARQIAATKVPSHCPAVYTAESRHSRVVTAAQRKTICLGNCGHRREFLKGLAVAEVRNFIAPEAAQIQTSFAPASK